ncbi:MAG: TRAP transporter small permease [Alphaproteobacteria bacterium]|jgi:TRAP-type C4-dicarboxylate transport system permease small subunit|nr:TRAP transporter small permease [Alphaproteobacteria bacterium]
MAETVEDSEGVFGRILALACSGLALAGGAVLLGIVGLTVVSILLRELTGHPIPGDYELVEVGCAVAVFAFLPYCQLAGGNVFVAFATAWAPSRLQAALDVLSRLAYAAIAALLAWRLTLGGMDLRTYGETTMVLGMPVWPTFLPIVPSLALLSIACLYTAAESLRKGPA